MKYFYTYVGLDDDFNAIVKIVQSPDGEWARRSDVEALEEERGRLLAENNQMEMREIRHNQKINNLRASNQRMLEALECAVVNCKSGRFADAWEVARTAIEAEKETTAADARPIAADSDLLEALNDVVRYRESDHGNLYVDPEADILFDRCRALIRRAKGEENHE